MTLIINGKTYEAGEFIAYVKTLEKENAELKQAKEGKVVEHFEAYGQCRDSRRIAELEAENAELKKKNLDTQDAVTMQMYTNKANEEFKICEQNADAYYDKLQKAKQIIQEFLDLNYSELTKTNTVFLHADKFLKESK